MERVWALTPDGDRGFVLEWPSAASDPSVGERVSAVPGLRRVGVVRWRGRLHRDTVLALRELVSGFPGYVNPDLAARLTAAADHAPQGPHRADNTESRPAPATDGVGRPDGLHAAPEPTAAAADPAPVFDANAPDPEFPKGDPLIFDGSLDGLRGVPITDLACVSDRKAEAFTAASIDSIFDLLHTRPRRYLDRSKPVDLDTAPRGVDVALAVTTTYVGQYDRIRKFVKAKFKDATGREVQVTWFRSPWVAKKLSVGTNMLLFGKLDDYVSGTGKRIPQMVNPLVDTDEDSSLPVIPIYPQSGTSGAKGTVPLSTWDVHRAVMETLGRLPKLDDPVDQTQARDLGLLSRLYALRRVHAPRHMGDVEAGRKRLAFDELLRIQLILGLAASRHDGPAKPARPPQCPDLPARLLTAVPFTLTAGQQSAWRTIQTELHSPEPMYRLLHGEVGSGKTMVALLAMLDTVAAGRQVAIMAPTDILAGQLLNEVVHATNQVIDGEWPIVVEWLASRSKAADRRRVLAGLADGTVNVIVGTHALLSDTVTFRELGLVVIDEQHRFGVEQRGTLRRKTSNVDCLVMTATPIPRTLALTVFGDLDVTSIPDLPPGRSPIRTHWVQDPAPLTDPNGTPWKQVRHAAQHGRPSFIICPLVGESEKSTAAAAETTHAELSHGALHGLRVGLVHGQQKPEDRDAVLHQLKNGQLDAVVGTTVLEVGVNVPKATQIVVIDAARFGIAQLHQLRGRIGRGPTPDDLTNDCWLLGEATTSIAEERLTAMTQTTSGLELAERDLSSRGIGDLVGSSQSGYGNSPIRYLDINKDVPRIEAAHEVARAILAVDPHLTRHPVWRTEITATIGDATTTQHLLRS